MKVFVWIILGFAAVIGIVAYFSNVSERDKEQAEAARIHTDAIVTEASARMQADIDYQNSRILEYTKGPIAAMEYRQCKNNPPKLPKNQEKCKQFDEFLKKRDAEEQKHPSW
jgi:hypothetical protein